LSNTFVEFVHRLPFYGVAVLCIDDPNVRAILDSVSRPMLTYGVSPDAGFRATQIEVRGRAWKFRATRPSGHAPLDVVINLAGTHNVFECVAAIAVATEEDVSDAAILAGLKAFSGVGRRFDVADDVRFAGKQISRGRRLRSPSDRGCDGHRRGP
jgi:UDP-N-acetylmuramate--alanine ligase